MNTGLRIFAMRLGAAVLCLCLLAVGLPLAAETATPLPGYVRMAHKDGLSLWADRETGWFAVENTDTGKLWHSVPQNSEADDRTAGSMRTDLQSQLVIQYIYKEDELSAFTAKSANSQTDCVAAQTVRTEEISDGLRVVYDFADLGVTVPVDYALKNGGLEASVVWDRLDVSDDVVLLSLSLLPAFGANDGGESGYLFIPDGCGALVEFNNEIPSAAYESLIYGIDRSEQLKMEKTQTETVRLPVFGIRSGADALCGILTEGDASASIVAYNRNASCGYDAVGTRRILRTLAKKAIYEKDPANRKDIGRVAVADVSDGYTVRYYFLSGGQADYTGMAAVYREYLLTEGGVRQQRIQPSLQLDLYGATDKQASFLGIPYTKTQKLTTFGQAQEILAALEQAGVSQVAVRYKGWSGTGLTNRRRMTKATPLRLLGGKKGLTQLEAYMQEQALSLCLDMDFLPYQKGADRLAVVTPFGIITKQYTWLRSVYSADSRMNSYRLLSLSHAGDTVAGLLKTCPDTVWQQVSFGSLGDWLYTNHAAQDTVERQQAAAAVSTALKQATDAGYSLTVQGGNAFALSGASRLTDVPISSGNADMFTQDVPFFQIALHGVLPMAGESLTLAAEPTDSFLRTVETGIELHYGGMYVPAETLSGTEQQSLYRACYTQWLPEAAQQYQRYMPLLQRIADQTIIRHETVQTGVVLTEYENGVRVLVNYTDAAVSYGGESIPAKDFAVLERGEGK